MKNIILPTLLSMLFVSTGLLAMGQLPKPDLSAFEDSPRGAKRRLSDDAIPQDAGQPSATKNPRSEQPKSDGENVEQNPHTPERPLPLHGVFTRNPAKIKTTPSRRAVREAELLTPRLTRMYTYQYPTHDPVQPTPTKSGKRHRIKRRSDTNLSREDIRALHERYREDEKWTCTVNAMGRQVCQRDEIIDPLQRERRDDGQPGRLNIERMLMGEAPIGVDGRAINLHHVTRQDPGPLLEITGGLHRRESGVLHFPIPDVGIADRPTFDNFRRMYWQARAFEMLKEHPHVRERLEDDIRLQEILAGGAGPATPPQHIELILAAQAIAAERAARTGHQLDVGGAAGAAAARSLLQQSYSPSLGGGGAR